MSTLRRTLLVTFAGLFLASCSATRPATPLECALIGGMLGGGTGTAIAVGAVDQDEEEAFAGFGIGAATGALIGYTICAVLEDKARRGEPAPVREPVAAPAPVVTKIVVLPGVNFGHDRAELSGDAKAVLRREVVIVLREDSDLNRLMNEKALISSAVRQPPRLVLRKLPSRSSRRAKAIEWIR